MSEWQVLDLPGDPAPGDPVRCRELATKLLHEAELAEHNTSRLRTVASTGGDLHMEGDYAPKFQQVLGELPDELAKLGKAYRRCGEAVSGFATGLEQAKTQAGAALRQGQDAEGRYQGALREIRAVLPPGQDPTLAGRLNDSLLESALATLDEGTKTHARAAARRARSAEEDRQRARRLATDAARLRGDAETTCVDGIHDALNDSGIKNKSWWEKAWDTISAPFRSWDAFIDLCGKVAMVAGIAAMFISGPIGWALMAAALVAGAAIMADTAVKYAQGKAGLGDLAFAALGCIPGGRGVVSLAKLGRGALGLARGLARGEGAKLVGAGLRAFGGAAARGVRNVATAIPHAFTIAGGIRGALRNPRLFARAAHCRLTGGDPIDMASGEVIMQQTDFELPGLLPLRLDRTHLSSYRAGRWFGRSWNSTLDQRLEVDGSGVCLARTDGVLLAYPHPGPGDVVLPAEGPRLPLTRTDDDGYTISDPDTGHTLHFPPLGELVVSDTDTVLLPLAAISDRNGHRIELTYDPDGMLTEIHHSGGYHLDVETHQELITAFRLHGTPGQPDQELIRYRYDPEGNLTEIINSSGQPLRFDYDTAGRMTRWADRNGTEYHYTYDDHGRCIHTSGTHGYLDRTITYDPHTRITTETDSLSHQTAYHVNHALQVEQIVNPLGHATVNEWDRYDRLLARTDPLGRTTRYTYDDTGNLVTVTRPDGTQVLATYNNLRQPTTITDPDGAVWQRQYDDRGNLTTLTDPSGATTQYTYDDRGCLATVTDALGHTRRIDTNAAGLPIAVTDPLGAVTSYDRDAFGRVSAVTNPVGGVTCFSWTIEGKLASTILPDGATERLAYDGEGNLIERMDALGQATRTESGHFDLAAARTAPDGARLSFTYDTELRLTAVTNPQCLVWRYEYDSAGNLVRETDFNGRVLTYAYDAAGQLIERTNGTGQTTRYTRNALGNIMEQRSDSTITTFAYDPVGRLLHTTNPNAELTFQRDPLGRVLAETCNGRTLTNTYDLLGRRTRRLTPTGIESTWDYDPNNQPIALHTAGRILRFVHDPAGREVERRLGEGVVLAQTWDTNHQLQSQTLTAGVPDLERQRRSYTYRPDGHVIGIDDHLSGSRRFDLDTTGRVTVVHGAGWTERYAYDPAGNITHATWPTSPQAETFDAEARGEREYSGTLIRRAGNVRYQHDPQGRVILRQEKRLSAKPLTWHYTWDADDRLMAVTAPGKQHWRYQYDPLGRRIAKQRLADDNTTVVEQINFTWDGVVLAEQTHTHSRPEISAPASSHTTFWNWEPSSFRPVTQTERTYLRDAPQEWVDEEFYAVISDLVGTPTEMVDPDGDITCIPRTTLWGHPLSPESVDTRFPLRFPGQYFDLETGLNYNYHRYYRSENGRYETADPLGLIPAPNPHTYVPNPTGWLDPLGLSPYEAVRDTPLARLGRDWESATRLGRQADKAEAADAARFGHGVSVSADPEKIANPAASVATRGQLEDAGFPVQHSPTARDPYHHTVQLPNPVTSDVAKEFNQVFGRSRR